MESFLFYTLVEKDFAARHQRVVGFFSKEKVSWDDYNLACILVFPPYQRKGLGKLLISFSYELSRMNRKMGSPEKRIIHPLLRLFCFSCLPCYWLALSDLGHKGYVAYWCSSIAKAIIQLGKDSVSINEISKATYIQPEDIRFALDCMGILVPDVEGGAPHVRLDKWKRGKIDEAYAINPKCIVTRA